LSEFSLRRLRRVAADQSGDRSPHSKELLPARGHGRGWIVGNRKELPIDQIHAPQFFKVEGARTASTEDGDLVAATPRSRRWPHPYSVQASGWVLASAGSKEILFLAQTKRWEAQTAGEQGTEV
jgi:hypothetical protein